MLKSKEKCKIYYLNVKESCIRISLNYRLILIKSFIFEDNHFIQMKNYRINIINIVENYHFNTKIIRLIIKLKFINIRIT